MEWPKLIIKEIIANACSPGLQQVIRKSYLTRQVVRNRGHREPEIGLLKLLLREGDSVADIGANIGVYTLEMSSLVGQTGHVYSFEPVAANYEILVDVIRKRRFGNVHAFRAALGPKPGRREMVIPDLKGFTGYYWARFAMPGDAGILETVDVLTLDELKERATIQRLQFIKCDVEGSELEVLNGGRDVIAAQHPGWLLEVSRETSEEVFAILKGLGYRAFVFDHRLIQIEGYLDKKFSNYFFLHPQSSVWQRASQHAIQDRP